MASGEYAASTPTVVDWRVRAAVVAFVCSSLLILIHFAARTAAGVMLLPSFLEPLRLAGAAALIAAAVAFAGAKNSSGSVAGRLLLAVTVVAAGITLLQRGVAGPVELAQALRLTLTSHELLGLTAATIGGTILALRSGSVVLSAAIGPLFPVATLICPGNDRLIALAFLPIALVVAAYSLVRRQQHQSQRVEEAVVLFGSAVLFYGPVGRGVANSSEAAVATAALLLAFHRFRRAHTVAWSALVVGVHRTGALTIGLTCAIALHRAAGLNGLVDNGWSPEAVTLAGLAMVIVLWFACRLHRESPWIAVGLMSPLFAGPALTLLPGWMPHLPVSMNASALPQSRWSALPSNGWAPRRRMHGGAVFDQKRRQIVMLGSDTHGWDWETAVYRFDLRTQTWSRDGIAAPVYTYRTDRSGMRVAGSAGSVPWAMHAYDQVLADPVHDSAWLISSPFHNPVSAVQNGRDPSWVFDFATARWRSLHPEPTPDFFSSVAVYDPGRDSIIASAALDASVQNIAIGRECDVDRAGVWELGPDRNQWLPATPHSPHGCNVSGVFDSVAGAMLVFERSGHFLVHRYLPGSAAGQDGTWTTAQFADGPCAHRRDYPPVTAVYADIPGITVLLPEGSDGRRRTCFYDARTNRLVDAGIAPPGNTSMNFTTAYDRETNTVLLVTGSPFSGVGAEVWSLPMPDTTGVNANR